MRLFAVSYTDEWYARLEGGPPVGASWLQVGVGAGMGAGAKALSKASDVVHEPL